MLDIVPKRPVSTKVVYQNPWITIHEESTVSSDGKKGTYAYLDSKDSVMVLAQNEDGALYMVRGFRYPTKTFGWELPGGGDEGEDSLVAAQRELLEETGITADNWELLGSALVCNGLMTERMAICLARGLHFGTQTEQGDETFEAMRFFTMEQIEQLIFDGEINDCQTMAGLHYYEMWKRRQEAA